MRWKRKLVGYAMNRNSCLVFGMLILLAAGCEKSPYRSVSGTVTFQGKLVSRGEVQFMPDSTKGNRGTGLGLSVSQKILKEHGGDILVESTPGEGSTFSLELPVILPTEQNELETPQTIVSSSEDLSDA